MGMAQKDFEFEIKSIETDGVFIGYGSVFGNVDQGNEIVEKGAFAESLMVSASKKRSLPILWQHRAGEPIGVYESVKEDGHGLLMKGRLLVDHVQRAKEAHALMKAGAVTGLSIGYVVQDDAIDKKSGVRLLKKLDLKETSLVTFPMNDEARVEVVKSMEHIIKAGRMPTLAEFEDFLRDSGGFSKSQATVIAGRGLRELLSRSESGSDPSDALQLLKSFSLK